MPKSVENDVIEVKTKKNSVNKGKASETKKTVKKKETPKKETKETKAKAVQLDENQIKIIFDEEQARITPRTISCNVYR